MTPDTWQPSGGSLVVMLDWENFPGIRPSHEDLPFDAILSFLRAQFVVEELLAYAHRSTLSLPWEERLLAAGFEIRLLDGLVDSNDKKNSLDLCLAMDAVRLAYTVRPEAYALLVAGDKDFAVVGAFIRRRLERRVVAFGSLYCPNPTLAEEVDRYFVLEQQDDWPRQLVNGTGQYVPRPFGAAVRRRAEAQRPYVVAGLVELGPDVPRALGSLMPAIKRRYPDFQTRGELRLSTIVEALGCQLSSDRQLVLAWSEDLVDVARTRAGERWVLPADMAPRRYVTDRARLNRLAECVRHGFEALGTAVRYPLPLSVVHGAVCLVRPEVRGLLSKRLRLWHVLEDLGFELTRDHTALLGARSGAARAILFGSGTLRQLPLFDEPGPEPPVVDRPPVFQMPLAMDQAEEELAQRVRHRRRTALLGPLFASISEQPRQQVLPFDAGRSEV